MAESSDLSEFTDLDAEFMNLAMAQAAESAAAGEVPVGAVLVVNDQVVAMDHNRPIATSDPSAHAEILCIRTYCQAIENYRLPEGSTLYVTLEPCAMCLGALTHARLNKLIYAAHEPRAGAIVSSQNYQSLTHFNHRIEVSSGLMANQSAKLLKSFFKQRRVQSKK